MIEAVTIEDAGKMIVNGTAHPAIRPGQKEPRAQGRRNPPGLRWQSRLLVCSVVPLCGICTVLYAFRLQTGMTQGMLLLSLTFALVVWRARAATLSAALAGGVLAAAMLLASVEGADWLRSALPALLALLLLTHLATHFDRRRKENLGIAENRRGRDAAQIVANLGIAGLAAAAVLAASLLSGDFAYPLGAQPSPKHIRLASLCAAILVTALAEATADTLSSEVGAVLGGEPVLITTHRRVAAGTDGAVSVAGTLAGAAGAILIVLVAIPSMRLSLPVAATCAAAAIAGMFFDSLLGATAEKSRWLNNDAVNFLSALAAALLAAGFLSLARYSSLTSGVFR